MRLKDFTAKKLKLRKKYKQIDDDIAAFKLAELERRLTAQNFVNVSKAVASLLPDALMMEELKRIECSNLSAPEVLMHSLFALMRKGLVMGEFAQCPICGSEHLRRAEPASASI